MEIKTTITTSMLLYGFTRSYTFSYFCFGKTCFSIKIAYNKHKHRFYIYHFKIKSEEVFHNMIVNSNEIKFFGKMCISKRIVRDIFN